MPDVHSLPAKAFRPEPADHDRAMAILKAQGLTMDGYLRACQRYLIANPAGALETIDPYWPENKRPGSDSRGG